MTKRIHVRDVSEETYCSLRARAAQEGLSMSDYLTRLIERDVQRPSWDEMVKRIEALEPLKLNRTTAALVRRARDSR